MVTQFSPTGQSREQRKAQGKLVLLQGHNGSTAQTGSLIACYKFIGKDEDLMRELLVEYYSGDLGRREIELAPLWLREKSVEDVVNLVMKSLTMGD